VSKDDTRVWGTGIETMLAASGGAAGLAYATLAALNADLAHGANATALVYADATAPNNGFYVKAGASGVGSWSRIGDLPNSIVRLTVTGGTGNAIVTTSPETPLVPGNKLYLMTATASNSAGAVTIANNGAAAAPLKDMFGDNPGAGLLANGLQALLTWSVDHFVMLSPVDASGILASAQSAATASATSATNAASSASALANQVHQYDTRTLAVAATIPSGVALVRVFGLRRRVMVARRPTRRSAARRRMPASFNRRTAHGGRSLRTAASCTPRCSHPPRTPARSRRRSTWQTRSVPAKSS
jgi:hypothetical protein